MIRSIRCPYCGLEVICNDEALTMAHQVPECPKFAAAVDATDGSPGTLVDREGNPLSEEELP